MNMKVRKSVIAFLMATTMVGSTAVPAMAAETLTVQDQGFYRSDGTKIEGAVAKSVYKDNWFNRKK